MTQQNSVSSPNPNKTLYIIIGVVAVLILIPICICAVMFGGAAIFSRNAVSVSDNLLAEDRNAQRESDVAIIFNALSQYASEGNDLNKLGIDTCDKGSSKIGSNNGNIDLAKYLVPDYLVGLPLDPKDNSQSGDTGYAVCLNGTTMRVTATKAENGKSISYENKIMTNVP